MQIKYSLMDTTNENINIYFVYKYLFAYFNFDCWHSIIFS